MTTAIAAFLASFCFGVVYYALYVSKDVKTIPRKTVIAVVWLSLGVYWLWRAFYG